MGLSNHNRHKNQEDVFPEEYQREKAVRAVTGAQWIIQYDINVAEFI